METEAISAALVKIKQQEQNQEAILKEKREYEASKVALKRAIQEAVTQSHKLAQERVELVTRSDELHAQLTIQRIRKDMLVAQLEASSKELEEMKAKVVQATLEIHELRSNYCKTVQEVSDECDVWALLKRPTFQPAPWKPVKKPIEVRSVVLENEERLKAAMDRKEKAMTERKRLLAEPDEGAEFVRIKNALRYSMEMSASLRQ